jgi:hypothetical protein
MRPLLTLLGLLTLTAPAAAQAPEPVPGPLTGDLTITEPPAPAAWRFWSRAEYLAWWIRGDHAAVPLVTTGPAGAARSGALGESTTAVLVGPNLDYRYNSGGKLFLGGWFDPTTTFGWEFTGFCLETHTTHEKAYSDRTDGSPVIARPFFNTLTGQQDAQVITTPRDVLGGRYLGGIGIFGDSRTWGGEANLLLHLADTPQSRWDLVGGFRYLGQKDQWRSDQSSTVLAPGTVGFLGTSAPAPDIVSLRDYLETANNFYGAQLGVQGRLQSGPWSFDVATKVGLGTTQQHLEATGRTLLTNSAGLSLYQPGGLFVPGWLSSMNRGELSFISEVNLRLGYRLGERWVASVGYTFLFWSDVVRPAHQINPAVDPRQVPTSLSFNPLTPAPPFTLHSADFWAQGLTVGLEFRY